MSQSPPNPFAFMPFQAMGNAFMAPVWQQLSQQSQASLSNPQAWWGQWLGFYEQQLQTAEAAFGNMVPPAPMASPSGEAGGTSNPDMSAMMPFLRPWVQAMHAQHTAFRKATLDWLDAFTCENKDLDPVACQRLHFMAEQFLDAMNPANMPFGNEDALEKALETGGQSLVQGLHNMAEDVRAGKLRMTDDTFKVGENLATQAGAVVHQSALYELIQYTPQTPKVHATPLLVCPPWINKFYILDLREKNSFVKFLVETCGVQVFLMSWKNPDARMKDVGWADYMNAQEEAMGVVQRITGQPKLNAMGYCIGGTALSCVLAKQGKKSPVNAITFLTTLTDFTHAGELGLFMCEEFVAALEAQMAEKGYLDGASMAATFSLLRANDLIWYFVQRHYLMGEAPRPFDILHWNSDGTNLAAKMHSEYLRGFYLENALVKGRKAKSGASEALQGLKLQNIQQPAYVVSARNDHITPWEGCYQSAQHMGSQHVRFVLTKAGHVAGVVNPPAPKGKPIKRSYWAGDLGNHKNAATWHAGQTETPDSWWLDFQPWLQQHSSTQIAAPKQLGSEEYPSICPAPGVYVLEDPSQDERQDKDS